MKQKRYKSTNPACRMDKSCWICRMGQMKILHLTLNKKWFDMILSGDKKEEYREIKPYWQKRLMMISPAYTHVKFNGYGKNRPSFIVELKFISTGYGRESWGAHDGIRYYCLRLGEIIKTSIGNEKGTARDTVSECSASLCGCIDKYSIAEHGSGYALYYGRCNHRHGFNLCFLSDFDNNGEQTRALIERALNKYFGT